jgi:hypothetical protein
VLKLKPAALTSGQIDRVFLTGGEFTGVARGLALRRRTAAQTGALIGRAAILLVRDPFRSQQYGEHWIDGGGW